MTSVADRSYFVGLADRFHVDMMRSDGVVVLGIRNDAGVRRVKPGDRVAYYSPKEAPDGPPLRAFTGLAEVAGGGPFMWPKDEPEIWARRADWLEHAVDVPIRVLLESLEFIRNPKNWGFYLRGSYREIGGGDHALISRAMMGGADG